MIVKAYNCDTLSGTYAKDAAALANAVKSSGADVVLLPGTSAVRRSAAGAAMRAGAEIDTNVVDASLAGDAVTVQKWAYRQRILTSFTRAAKPWVIVTDPSLFGEICGKLGASAEALPACGNVETRTVQNGLQAASGGGESTIKPDAELLFVAVGGLLPAVSSLVECGPQASRALGAVAPGLWRVGLVVEACGLSCFGGCGIFLDQGWNLCPLNCRVVS